MADHKHTNELIHETSPYLLQHAHNPVKWVAWSKSALERAESERKLVLISVGYSACHWCHVMERECFEDEKVAQLMNDYFICIKVDREERPDIDQIYMLAVQLMTGHGGWPLNCFALPDGRPIYGGTYFPKQQWVNVLLNLTDLYKNEPEKVVDYAKQLTEGIKLSELVKTTTETNSISPEVLKNAFNNWETRFDKTYGGPNKAPKFPLPNNYLFLLHYSITSKNEDADKQLHLTLNKMAFGGIYDQLGGGFSRYSVDAYWKVPHFEKMLYDNAQLVSLYSEAFLSTKNELYKQIVYETLDFVNRELSDQNDGFYAALDADSEGEEGKYYVWQKKELEHILSPSELDLLEEYYNINENGYWEHDNYILLRNKSDKEVANKRDITLTELESRIRRIKTQLLFVRQQRKKPGLDNKIITSWNALMAKAYLDAYTAFGENSFKEKALKNIQLLTKDGVHLKHILHSKNEMAFLEDHCFLIEALISCYQATFIEMYLHKANEHMKFCIDNFQDNGSKMFYFTSKNNNELIARKMEVSDNVIPASNSSMAKSLFLLGHYFENDTYLSYSKQMLDQILPELENYPEGYSNWGILAQWMCYPFYEIAIVGKSVDEKMNALKKHYLPNVIFAGTTTDETEVPLLKNRLTDNKTLIYVCVNKTCNKPVESVEEALTQIQN